MRIWAQILGTDPVLRHIERFPVSGERLCEAILYKGDLEDARGWLVRNRAGRIVFSDGQGSIRTVDANEAERALSAMEKADAKLSQDKHQRIDGKQLQSLLDAVGYSRSGFAREWGVSYRNVCRWCADDLDVPLWAGKVLQIMSAYRIAPTE